MSKSVLDFLLQRRSAKAGALAEPGPTQQQLDAIFTAAVRVPDHKKVVPWRFVVFAGDARAEFGRILAATCKLEDKSGPSEVRLATEQQRLMRAPVVIAAISQVKPMPGAPEWEQILSCGAACFNLCLAANALGFGTCWITEWYSYSAGVRSALKLAENERVAGFIYIGTEKVRQEERERPDLKTIVTRWSA